ncbi:hypothetical protein VTL71DRAFT_6780 [Oculimacula yallundae]|uniref:FAD-binding PCMH-type domain-containing protein n=1 Tax=Oculimacula yallundae TaxID=86028 RepID=A0ABR4BXX1_9HELO
MATLNCLKQKLREKAAAVPTTITHAFSDSEYSIGFELLKRGSTEYEEFIIPQLTQLLASLLKSRTHVSILEIGPGPESILVQLPNDMKRKITKYVAYEPNGLFVSRLEDCLSPTEEGESPFPCLRKPPKIHGTNFNLDLNTEHDIADDKEKFDLVLLCHSLYGMGIKRKVIEKSLEMVVGQPEGGLVVVFHRSDSLDFEGLVCHQTTSYPTGTARVQNDDEALDNIASFVAGSAVDGPDSKAVRMEWRKVCHDIGKVDEENSGFLSFSSPNIMVAFTKHATALPKLLAQVPLVNGNFAVKNREARIHRPACVVGPKTIRHVQECVQWALTHKAGLTVIGGGHSGHCVAPNVVCVDMSAFNKIHIVKHPNKIETGYDSESRVVVESGCKSGDIIRETMDVGLTVPLGARPSVGAGVWLQGGIGHLARLHGLACDNIVGAVVISVSSGQILCVGEVPCQHQPAGFVRPDNDEDLLWALKGAGTNFGIVISVTFKAYPARTYALRNRVTPLRNDAHAKQKILEFGKHASNQIDRTCSADAYLYWESDQLRMGVTTFESTTTNSLLSSESTITEAGLGNKVVDGVSLFESEMYMSAMHGGHGGGKTSSFKRCLLLKRIGDAKIAKILISAIKKRPGPFCYLHLLHGGEAVKQIAADATAFGCRDWDFACVVTGVWPRDQDGTEVARAAVEWVYDVAQDLLPLCSGVYGADLGPDPRDAALAGLAFGKNLPRLARLKQVFDPWNVLAYACPIPSHMTPTLIILVTGNSCAGKDYGADIWGSALAKYGRGAIEVRVVSISDLTKREYAIATGASLKRLQTNRAYKEKHRPALTEFFRDQMKQRPRLLEEHFLKVVYDHADVDVLFITGMRETAPVVALSHLVPESKLIDIRVEASKEIRSQRGGYDGNVSDENDADIRLDYRPSLLFENDMPGSQRAEDFARDRLLPFLYDGLQELSNMVQCIPDFPRPGIKFRDVLAISQQPGGTYLYTSLFYDHFTREWNDVDKIVCCEAGGFVFASALAAHVGIPLALIRDAGKLPPPTISGDKTSSHISSVGCDTTSPKRIEMGRDVVHGGASVVFVDDVLATGRTLVAILQLLVKASVQPRHISVMVVAEFPVHRGRRLLYKSGFGGVEVCSLLVFGGV